MADENRTIEQLREQYEIEKELADRLRSGSRQERRHLYSLLYDELYRRVPHHPQLTHKASPQEAELVVRAQMGFLKPFLDKSSNFLEVGPGDCALSFEVAKFVGQVYAVDVSEEITRSLARPANFHLILSDGCSIPLPANSVHLAYSNQLMEHLHPDDAFEQLENIYRALTPGGVYICVTPNRLSGPHDISGLYDEVATGFHLKEYSISELNSLFRKVGFSRIRVHIGIKGKYVSLSAFPIVLLETILDRSPRAIERWIARSLLFRPLSDIRLVATK
jgi:SAM-dependent methyltransferase